MQLSLGLAEPGTRIAVLGSGSSGNCVVVESGHRRLLLDAGFSCREIERRLAMVGLDRGGIDGLVLTHEHGDHCRGVARFAKRNRVPVYATAGTLQGIELDPAAVETVTIQSGVPVEIGSFIVEPFSIPHDAREPVGLVVEDTDGHRVGLAGDMGMRTHLAWESLRALDILIIETNHDLEMLRSGPYPWALKQRVASRHGHLSNRDAADGVPELVSDRLRWVVLYHLSRTNNLPMLAAESVGAELDRLGSEARVEVSSQSEPTRWLGAGERIGEAAAVGDVNL